MDVERIVVTLMADASQYQRAMREVTNGLTSAVRDMSLFGSVMDAAVSVPTLAAVGAFGAVSVAAGGAAYAAVQLAANYERAGIAFEVMTGSAARGKQLLDEVNQVAIESPFRSGELTNAAKQLRAFGLETDQIVPVMKSLGDVSAGTGTRLWRITLAFGQVMTAGRLTGDELRQFNNAGVPLIENLAAVLNKPKEAIRGMVERGEVGADRVVAAFNRMTRGSGTFADMMRRVNDTVSGQWQSLVERSELLLRDVGLAFFEGFGVRDFLKGVGSWVTDLQQSAQQGGGLREWFAARKDDLDWLIGHARDFSRILYDGLNLGGAGEAVGGVIGRVREAFRDGTVDEYLAQAKSGLVAFFTSAQDYALIAWRVVADVYGRVRDVVVETWEAGVGWVRENESAVREYGSQVLVAAAAIVAFRTALFVVSGTVAVVWALVGAVRFLVTTTLAAVGAFQALRTAVAVLGLVQAAVTGLSSLSAVLNPVTLLVGGLAAGVAFLVTQFVDVERTWKSFVSSAAGVAAQLSSVFAEAGTGFADAVRANDMELAWKIVFKGIEIGWKVTLNAMKAEWERFVSLELSQTVDDALRGTELALNDFRAATRVLGVSATYLGSNDSEGMKREIDQIRAERDRRASFILQQSLVGEQQRRNETEGEMRNIRERGLAPLREELRLLTEQARVRNATVRQQVEAVRLAAVQAAQYNAVTGPTNALGAVLGAVGMTAEFGDYGRRAGLNAFGAAGGGVFSNLGSLPPPRQYAYVPPGLEPRVRELADELNKAFDKGVSAAEKYSVASERIWQAYRGTPLDNRFQAALGGMGFVDPRQVGMLLTLDRAQIAQFQQFQQLRRDLASELEVKLPPAALMGSAEAQDTINRSAEASRSQMEEIRRVLELANQKHDEEIAETKKVVKALEKLKEEGLIMPKEMR